MIMLIISQNLSNYDVTTPEDSVLRINLAWIDDLNELKRILTLYSNSNIFLDLPIKRTKPPNNKYTLQELSHFFLEFRLSETMKSPPERIPVRSSEIGYWLYLFSDISSI